MNPTSPIQLASNRREAEEFFARRLKQLDIAATTQTASGQMLDWIPRASQVPGGRIASPPPELKTPVAHDPDRADRPALAELLQQVGERGPSGTVPVRRPMVALMDHRLSLKQRRVVKKAPPPLDRKLAPPAPDYKGHYYGNSYESGTWYGGQGIFSCFVPAVSAASHFSLVQIGVTNSQQGYFQSVEAGWQLFPNIFGSDWVPHLFTYFTTNGYSSEGDNIGGYNTEHKGWIQYDSSYYPGMTFTPRSVWDGDQRTISIKYQLYQGNWWLNVQGVWLGYYPVSIYGKSPAAGGAPTTVNTLGNHADNVGFWGEVYDPDNTPPSTQMGSGYFANVGWRWSAYMHNLEVQSDAAGTLKAYDGIANASDASLYTISSSFPGSGSWGSHAYVGGPGSFSALPSSPAAAYNQIGLTQTDVFAIDKNGTLFVAWVDGGGPWNGPVPISPPARFPAAAPVAASQQFGLAQTDVFAVDKNGALTVSWVVGGGVWSGPIAIGPAGRFFPGTRLAAGQQFGLNQTDVFAIDKNGALTVSWVDGAGSWSGPAEISPWERFVAGAPVASSQQFGLAQTDVFAVDRSGALTVSWVDGAGAWNGPAEISAPGMFLPNTSVTACQQVGLTQTDVFAVDKNGALRVSWVDGGGAWQGPAAISPPNTFVPGSAVAASRQFGLNQTDVFAVDNNGTLTVTWVVGAGNWTGPVPISPVALALPGAPVSVAQQAGLDQTDVFVVDRKGDLNLFWVSGAGHWNGPIHP
jgi:hypothetical protein